MICLAPSRGIPSSVPDSLRYEENLLQRRCREIDRANDRRPCNVKKACMPLRIVLW